MAKRCGASRWSGLIAALVVLLPVPASACDDPVYRYALERWQPDDFLLVAPAAAQGPLRQELDAVSARGPRPNLVVLDLAEAERIGRPADSDQLVLLAPPDGWQPGRFEKAWSGPPTPASLALIADSPARRELARRLITGEAIVWVVVDRGDADVGDGLKRLDPLITAFISDVVAMDEAREDEPSPDGTDTPAMKPSDKAVFWPPRMSVLRVRADDPQEQVFLAVLTAAAEPKAAESSAVFPVFGRGRTLGGIRLAELNAAEFRSACDFLTNACSCEVKEMSPGSDLLLAADWNAVPKLIPQRGADAFADLEPGDADTETTAHPASKAADPKPTVGKPAAATTPAAGLPMPPLAVWLAAVAGLLVCLAWRAQATR